VHAGEEGYARPGWTTSRHGQDSLWKSLIRMTEDGDKWRKYVHDIFVIKELEHTVWHPLWGKL